MTISAWSSPDQATTSGRTAHQGTGCGFWSHVILPTSGTSLQRTTPTFPRVTTSSPLTVSRLVGSARKSRACLAAHGWLQGWRPGAATRFMFDMAATPLFDVDPSLLSWDMPPMDPAVAMDTVMEVAFFRAMMSASCWKLMRRLNIGPKRKLKAAHKVLRGFIMEMMERRKINTCYVGNGKEQESVDILSSLLNDPEYADNDLLRAMIVSYMLAARDTVGTTLTWIFYNLAQHPKIVSIIHKELSPIASHKVAAGADAMVIFEPNETKSLVYLRAVLYETLRLHPPAPLERKMEAANDIMPSGHEVHTGDTIFISLYSMGRMEGIWGKDCLNYNPDRWLSEDGSKLRYVPSHKFLAFNSGPRMCLGKDIAFMLLRTVIASTLWNFDVEVMEGQSIQAKPSCILEMKNGLMVKLKKREI
ncbi:hypothetical protein VPH35_026030 [Triticum aestivum]